MPGSSQQTFITAGHNCIKTRSFPMHNGYRTDVWSTCSLCWFTTCLDCLYLHYQMAESKEKVNCLFLFKFNSLHVSADQNTALCCSEHCAEPCMVSLLSMSSKLCIQFIKFSCWHGKAAWKLENLEAQPSSFELEAWSR